MDAASRIFAAQGVHVPLDTVIETAGVSRATLYRHFPDRTTLLLALFDREMARVTKAGQDAPPAEALVAMIVELGHVARQAPALADAWRAIAREHPELEQRHNNVLSSFAKPLTDAIAAGQVRSDLTVNDVVRISRMVAAASRQDTDDEDAPARIIELILSGVRKRD